MSQEKQKDASSINRLIDNYSVTNTYLHTIMCLGAQFDNQ